MARRGRGEGTIRYRTGEDRWEGTITLGSQRKSFYGKTRREVAERLRAAQRDYEAGQFIGDQRQTVEQYLVGWLETKRPDVKESTWLTYEYLVRLYITPMIGRVKLTQLTAQQVQRVVAGVLAAGRAGKTANEVYGVLHQALRSAERLGLVARDVSERVDRPRFKTQEMRPLSPDEANAFLDAARGHWLEPLFRLALTTGMRQGELMALRWRDVELEAHRLSVVATMRWRGGDPVYTSPKTKRSRRQIAFPPEMAAALVAYRQRQRMWRVKAGPAWQGERYGDPVFSDELGFPLRAKRVAEQFKRLLRDAGLPVVRFHDLRHTCATLLLGRGVHPKVVSELLGHATVNMTLDRYSHVLPHMQEEAARAIGDTLQW